MDILSIHGLSMDSVKHFPSLKEKLFSNRISFKTIA